jgi:hypothetical protein
VQWAGLIGLWGFFVLAVIDVVVLGFLVSARVTAKFGEPHEKVRWYAAMRALQLRAMRLLKPQVKRWQYPA